MCEFWSKGYGFESAFSCIEAASIAHTTGRPIVAAEAFTADAPEAWELFPADHEGPGRLGLLHGGQPHRLSPLSASTVARPLAGHDHGPLRRALGTHADVVGHGAGLPPVPGALPVLCRGWAPWPTSATWPRKVRRTCFAPRRSARGPASATGAATTSMAVLPKSCLRRPRWRRAVWCFPEDLACRLLVLPGFETMTPALLRRVEALVAAGATVVGSPPEARPA